MPMSPILGGSTYKAEISLTTLTWSENPASVRSDMGLNALTVLVELPRTNALQWPVKTRNSSLPLISAKFAFF